jgi:ribonuclease BN (tRNA processing enzyme)
MSMRLFIGGMRGSQPAAGAAFDKFGGDTTSLLLLGAQGERLVLDAGTGMRAVARELATLESGGRGEACLARTTACVAPTATVLFSHYHLDHVIGLTMNPLFYESGWSFTFVGPASADGDVREAVTRILAPPYWPVSWQQMNARFDFATLDAEDVEVGNLRVRQCPMPHPGGCRAYRIDDSSGTALVYATDIEWRDRTPAQEAAFITMCTEPEPADMLVIDAHFAKVNAETFVGWGHTSWEDGVAIAESVGIERVLLGHHAPEANDQALTALEQQVKERMPAAALARAGQWLTIEGRR